MKIDKNSLARERVKDRILRASSTSTLTVQAPREKSRPTKYKLLKFDQLVKAYDAVVSGELSVRRAAEEFDVPRAMLHDRLTGRIHFGASSGPPKFLLMTMRMYLHSFLRFVQRLALHEIVCR